MVGPQVEQQQQLRQDQTREQPAPPQPRPLILTAPSRRQSEQGPRPLESIMDHG